MPHYFLGCLGLARRFGQTEREKTRFVETRSFLVAAVILGFESKNIIEVGGLNHPVIIALANPSSYTAFNNPDYIDRFHASHADIISNTSSCKFSYYTHNFEESNLIAFDNPNSKIVYSSNTFEHVQDTNGFLNSIYSLGSDCVAYLCFGPIRSHSLFGHHSSYDSKELLLKSDQLDCFHLLSQEAQFKIVKDNAKRSLVDLSDTQILEALSKSNISPVQMLNNYTYSDYHRIFHTSKLCLEKFDTFVDLSSQFKESKRRLYAENPNIGDISTRNILATLSVSHNYFNHNYPHLTVSTDFSATHWLQAINF